MTVLEYSQNSIAIRFKNFFDDFFFKPASAKPLALFRIFLCMLLLVQAFVMRKHFLFFFSPHNLIQGEANAIISDPTLPNLYGVLQFLSEAGISTHHALIALAACYIFALIFLLLGLYSNFFAFLVWFLHWSLLNTGYSGAYGADMYAHIFLFYLIWIPCGYHYSLDQFFKRTNGLPSYKARLGLRVLQLHMCISYLTSGIEKASSVQWWNGEVIYKALNTPGYNTVNFDWLAHVPALPMFSGWCVLAIEIFYCVLVWPQKTRAWWIYTTCLMHIGIALFLNLPIFGFLMCIPSFTLFIFSPEPQLTKA